MIEPGTNHVYNPKTLKKNITLVNGVYLIVIVTNTNNEVGGADMSGPGQA